MGDFSLLAKGATMTERAANSFEIHTAREYLDGLVRPALDDFLTDTLSSRKAIACAIFTWHLRDWVWVQNKAELQNLFGVKKIGDFDSYLFTNCPSMVIIRNLATGSKHFKADGSAVQTTELAHGFPIGPSLLITQSHLTVKTETDLHFAEHLFENTVAYWEGFLTESGLLL